MRSILQVSQFTLNTLSTGFYSPEASFPPHPQAKKLLFSRYQQTQATKFKGQFFILTELRFSKATDTIDYPLPLTLSSWTFIIPNKGSFSFPES